MMADLNECVIKCLAETGGATPIPPRPPSLQQSSLLLEAGNLVQGDATVQTWMRAVGLDPAQDEDCLVAIGLIVAVPRESPTAVPA
jgi:hypothetical protein